MENMDKKSEGKGGEFCQGGCCGGMHGMYGYGSYGGKHHLAKTILKLLIVIIIFWSGFKLGEITGAIRAEYGGGYGMMRGGYGMMGNGGAVTP